jgi:hypothetical protein
MEDSGVVTITGRMLTIGGHQIETITIASRHNAGRSISSTRPSAHWMDTSKPAQAANLRNKGSRTSADVTSDWSSPGWLRTAPLVRAGAA